MVQTDRVALRGLRKHRYNPSMPAKHPIVDALVAILGEDGVLWQGDELGVYECDGFPIAKGLPTAVAFPERTEQVAQCVKLAKQHDLPIIPRGSGTGLAGGAVAYGEGLIVSTTRMNRIEEIDIKNRVAVVQPGVRNLSLSDAIAHTGLRFSPDPSSQRASTIGGNFSTNAGGINTLKHGVTTNHILGVEYVLPDGSVFVSRPNGLYDGIGPDVAALLCGSEGTLVIVTRLWCRLVPSPRHFRTVYAIFQTIDDACHSVADVTAAGIVPTSMEMMDGGMIRVVEDAFHFGFPTDANAMLLIEIDGVDEVLDEQMEVIVSCCRANKCVNVEKCADPQKRAELWSARKKAFGAIGRISRSYCTQDACVPRSKLPEVLAGIAKIGEQYNIVIHNVFHAGDGNVHPIMLFDEDNPEEVQRTLRCSEDILEFCIEAGGTITGEHGVGVEKLHLMDKMFNAATLDAFNDIKETLDPDRRINDAKLIPSKKLMIELLEPLAVNVPGGAM